MLWCVRLREAPGAVGGVCQSQPMHVGVEEAVSISQSGDCCIKDTAGGVGPPVVS